MRKLLIIIFINSWIYLVPAQADDGLPLEYEFLLIYEATELDSLTLGDEPREDRFQTKEPEFEFGLQYQINDHWYAFFVGSLVDNNETIEPANLVEEESGLERKQIGIGVSFGEEIESDLNIGRVEFVSISESWLWWDEELDAIRLESSYGDIEAMIGFAEEQAREATYQDRIDPEVDDVKRIIASLGWEFFPNQSLHFYYLDQEDDSKSFYDGIGSFDDCNDGPPSPACVSEEANKIDEEDADLEWTGISYLGEFDTDAIGELEVELHYARVSGDEVLYEFDDRDPLTGLSEVTNRQENSISASARGFQINWTPAQADDWSFILGRAEGEHDFRQTGLQGDADVYGELFQPELANLIVDTVGIEWEINEYIEVALLTYEYEQDRAIDELRDATIDFELNGTSKDIGKEIDLVVTVTAIDDMELKLVVAEFEAGEAYDLEPGRNYKGETSRFWKFELEYEF